MRDPSSESAEHERRTPNHLQTAATRGHRMQTSHHCPLVLQHPMLLGTGGNHACAALRADLLHGSVLHVQS